MLTRLFFEEYWQKRVLWSSSRGADHGAVARRIVPSKLITLSDVERLLSSLTQVDRNWIQLVKGGDPLLPARYCTAGGLVSLPGVYAAYEAGHTLQLAKLHKRWPAIGRLCREVEITFAQAGVPLAMRIGSHLYVTPPHSTGLRPHYDNHDVLVVQAEGTKRWRIYGARQPYPVEMQRGTIDRADLPPLEHDVVLEPGDVLYVPRGQFHEASTAQDHSIHVTLDVTPFTWADLMTRMARKFAWMRESLPVGGLGHPGDGALSRGFVERCAALADTAGALGPVLAAMLDHFLADLDLLPGRGLEQLDAIASVDLDTLVQRRRGTLAMVLLHPSGPMLCFPGAGIRGAPGVVVWLCKLAEQTPFAVRDLPDELDAAGKIDAARDLLRRGFLELTGPTRPPEALES